MCDFSCSTQTFTLAAGVVAVALSMLSHNCPQAVAGPRLEKRHNQDDTWGIVVGGAGMASVEQSRPMQLEIWDDAESDMRSLSAGYDSLVEDKAGLIGAGCLTLGDGVSFQFEDCWKFDKGVLSLDRTVKVKGNAPGGFLSGAVLRVASPQTWPQIEWFAPGMLYGNFDFIPSFAIGGRDYYRPGAYTVRIREDRLPAPLVGALFNDHSSLAVLNRSPRGDSTAAEAMSFSFDVMIDKRFQFGAIGAEERDNTISLGYWFPGSEGEQAYAEKRQGVNGGRAHHRWRRRFHPIQSGFTQQYQAAFRFGRAEGLNDLCRQSWRWAWRHLRPEVNPQRIDLLRRSIVDALASQVIEAEDRAGIGAAVLAVPGKPRQARHYRSIMGFIGKTIEGAEFMLAESLLDDSDRGKRLRRQAEKIINTFTRLKMNPPESEGLFVRSGKIQEGKVAATINGRPEVYLRCLCDDMKAVLRAYQRERRHGIEHPGWLDWARQFADWLLTQQQPGGGFPRAWRMGSGEVLYESPSSSFNAVPFLLRLHEITGERKYRQAALQAGEFTWQNGQMKGRFVGGTVDNADVIDKEAATISLECYLDLYDATKDSKWIDRAKVAADIAETWMYIWNVPMPADAEDEDLQWKRGTPTTGLQLISTGHTLVDAYMSFDVDEFVRLYKATGDEHYLDVARILLHNTKAMVELPDRCYGLRGPGWQQEHYSLAQPRGRGRHQYWLPWVATSQLNGVFGLMEVDPELYQALAKPNE